MTQARPLPAYLIKRYRGWKATELAENAAWFARLASEGQRPRAMVVSCCDSRVQESAIFGAVAGDFFVHRNIANLVPPNSPDATFHGTSAALEYAVNHLHIANLIVLGHSHCGGVAGCYDMCSGNASELEEKTSFIGRWVDTIRPGFDAIASRDGSREDHLHELERKSIELSLKNLMTFPFVAAAVENGTLDLHGLHHDIGTGNLEYLNPESGAFEPV